MTLVPFVSGAVFMGYMVAALFFLRFWRQSQVLLFLYFGISFTILGAAQALMTLLNVAAEDATWIYLLRLSAFLVIVYAIWRHNRRSDRQ